jgi:hypothetical protein
MPPLVKASRAHDGASSACVKSKIVILPLRNCAPALQNPLGTRSQRTRSYRCLHGRIRQRERLDSAHRVDERPSSAGKLLLVLATLIVGADISAFAQDEPVTERGHRREELGVNTFTAPSIERVFQQLDKLKPLPFNQLWRDLPPASPSLREQKGMIFGGLVAEGFLVVEAEKRNLVDDLGRVLIREARGLGVADRVMRHSASLTELGRAGNWMAVRKELIATQADVEQAMVELRDQKMAHLISLGGWLRGLEISAGAVESNFSPQRASVLAQPELIDYFTEELSTLPPSIAHTPLFEQVRSGVKAIRGLLSQETGKGLQRSDVKAMHAQARDLNLAIRRAK